ncbi:MAG: metallophosphoesterase [Alphaproteobacteria bacterium]|nr:metallophosphoesterase [Alphaproteobacteria bacterium]
MALAGATRRFVLWFTLGGLLVGTALTVWGFIIEPNRLVTTELVHRSPKWPAALPPLRIVSVSDIHTGSPHLDVNKLSSVVRRINALQPDIVLLLGDYVIHGVLFGRFVTPEATAKILGGIRAKYGVFAVLGNHDWWLDGPRIQSTLRTNGIAVLENRAHRIEAAEGPFWIAGISDDTTRHPDPVGALRHIPAGEPVIVFSHDPAIFPDVPGRAAITVAGHTHGGQIYLPWIGALIVPGRAPRRHAHGLIEENGKAMIVTSGLGTSIIPVRINMPPEIASITLMSEHAQIDR